MQIFIELTLLITIATVIGFVMKFLKQPLIVGYIFAGILAGPYFLNILHAKEQIELFSQIGITILLFIIGLSLNPNVVKEIGKVSLFAGIGQVVFTTIIGFLVAIFLGIEKIAALYIAIALTFSSTIIILKLLSDKGDLHKLYGKIAIGFLLVQDIIASIILIVISSLAAKTLDTNLYSLIGVLLIKGGVLLFVLYFASFYILPKLSKFTASSKELLFLFSMTWGFGLAALFYVLGFSIEIGALIAGVTLSLTPFSYEIGARLKPLRDFFIVLFFVLLGSKMVLTNIDHLIIPALILSLFVLIGNPIIMIILMNLLGYKRKTGFLTGITVAQISEFSLILATLGFNLGQLSQEMLSLITFVGLVTIAGSTYFILYADNIYPYAERLLKYLELRKTVKKGTHDNGESYDIFLFGYDRVGSDFIHLFKKLELSYLVVDFNPHSIKRLDHAGIPHRFGDAEDPEFLEELPLAKVKLVISTIPDFKTNLFLTKKIKSTAPKAITIVISNDIHESESLYHAGASYVIMPHYLGAQYTSQMINKLGIDPSAFKEEREKHLEYLNKRKTKA